MLPFFSAIETLGCLDYEDILWKWMSASIQLLLQYMRFTNNFFNIVYLYLLSPTVKFFL